MNAKINLLYTNKKDTNPTAIIRYLRTVNLYIFDIPIDTIIVIPNAPNINKSSYNLILKNILVIKK